MRTEIHLDKSDIEAIIANWFSSPLESIYVECFMDTEGYGKMEHNFPNVRAIVTSEGGVKREQAADN